MRDPDFFRFHGTKSYLTDEALESAVDCALALQRPLLVRGEPGTGKTLLAEAVAEALGATLLRWQIKSTTRAQEGLYTYDTVRRLYDSRFGDADVHDVGQYIDLGPLGQAFAAQERVVLLIDEIDKADIEFPNDLLHELDRMSFSIMETNTTIEAKHRPVVIMTSNNEKELPDALLRRCVFHFLAFPDEQLMRRIVRVHHPDLDERLVSSALEVFYGIRKLDGLRKRPSTSELIDWLAVLEAAGIEQVQMKQELPFLGTLLKKEHDLVTWTSSFKRTRRW